MIRKSYIETSKHKISSLPPKEILKLEISVLLEYYNTPMIAPIQPLEHPITFPLKFAKKNHTIKKVTFGV